MEVSAALLCSVRLSPSPGFQLRSLTCQRDARLRVPRRDDGEATGSGIDRGYANYGSISRNLPSNHRNLQRERRREPVGTPLRFDKARAPLGDFARLAAGDPGWPDGPARLSAYTDYMERAGASTAALQVLSSTPGSFVRRKSRGRRPRVAGWASAAASSGHMG
ncbi:hypothetical protein GCM10010104_26010 [Streptomyces indiaensis]|uniref:Uncharacterized protein n=1 Tax=Streptomyces indiaensis TaxID=284033 RepID=A0ABN3DHB5_9ACTN